ncbi:MAG: hypothetical protein PHO86_03235 [Bacilli bacterium]|nr:hypothetical protein [Bacilli bacterium]
MKKLLVSLLFFLFLFVTGCSSTAKVKPEMITGDDNDEYGGADCYDNLGDHADSNYWVNPDFYNLKSNDNLTILSNYQTFLQTTEYTCGPSALLTIFYHFGITNYTEMDLAIATKTSVDEDVANSLPGSADNFFEYGANVQKIYQFLKTLPNIEIIDSSYVEEYSEEDLITADDGFTTNDIGNLFPTFTSYSLYASENSYETESWVEDAKDSYFVKWVLNHLQNNCPILVEWGDWDGHWMAIIGYDTLGTPGIGDDVLIFADPYDTSDHWQDGYYYYPAERWFYMWQDRNVAPKPYQLQPYIVINVK